MQIQKVKINPQNPFSGIIIARNETSASIRHKIRTACNIFIKQSQHLQQQLKKPVIPTEILDIAMKIAGAKEVNLNLFEILLKRADGSTLMSRDAMILFQQFSQIGNNLLNANAQLSKKSAPIVQQPAPQQPAPQQPTTPTPTAPSDSGEQNLSVVARIIQQISVQISAILSSKESISSDISQIISEIDFKNTPSAIADGVDKLLSKLSAAPQGELSDVMLRAALKLKELVNELRAELAKTPAPTTSSSGETNYIAWIGGAVVLWWLFRGK